MQIIVWVLFIISLAVSSVIVNKSQQMFMRFIGSDMMFFSMKKKVFIIVILALFLEAFILKIFGITL